MDRAALHGVIGDICGSFGASAAAAAGGVKKLVGGLLASIGPGAAARLPVSLAHGVVPSAPSFTPPGQQIRSRA